MCSRPRANFTRVVRYVKSILSGGIKQRGDGKENKDSQALEVREIRPGSADGLKQGADETASIGNGGSQEEFGLESLSSVQVHSMIGLANIVVTSVCTGEQKKKKRMFTMSSYPKRLHWKLDWNIFYKEGR